MQVDNHVIGTCGIYSGCQRKADGISEMDARYLGMDAKHLASAVGPKRPNIRFMMQIIAPILSIAQIIVTNVGQTNLIWERPDG